MLQTAENVAKKHAISTAEQHAVTLRRLEQYREALANDRAFQRRFMSLPFEIPRRDFKKIERTIDGDEGICRSTPEAIAKLRPMMEGGSVTFGGQTHPSGKCRGDTGIGDRARGNGRDRCRSPSKPSGLARRAPNSPICRRPQCQRLAPRSAVPATRHPGEHLAAVKTHNPFAVNDVLLSRESAHQERMNSLRMFAHLGTSAGLQLQHVRLSSSSRNSCSSAVDTASSPAVPPAVGDGGRDSRCRLANGAATCAANSRIRPSSGHVVRRALQSGLRASSTAMTAMNASTIQFVYGASGMQNAGIAPPLRRSLRRYAR